MVKDKLSKQDEEEVRMFRGIKRTTKPDSDRLGFTFGILGTELAAYLCKVLTGQQDPEQTQETMDNTRDYRVKWLKRMPIPMQNKMFNYLSFLDELIYDTFPLIERESEAREFKDKLSEP